MIFQQNDLHFLGIQIGLQSNLWLFHKSKSMKNLNLNAGSHFDVIFEDLGSIFTEDFRAT